MSVSVTLPVPPSIYRIAKRTAEATSRSIEKVLIDVLAASSPVSDDLPPELEADLDTLAKMSDAELWKIARNTFPTEQRRKYDRLLKKNSAGRLTPAEREKLQELRLESERLMLQKAHAYVLLKWRGYALPALTKLPRPR
jgi:hypothetical protein